jgi:hypothetical protein
MIISRTMNNKTSYTYIRSSIFMRQDAAVFLITFASMQGLPSSKLHCWSINKLVLWKK